LIVGNLNYFFEQLGWEKPYNVWLRTAPATDYAQIHQGIEDIFSDHTVFGKCCIDPVYRNAAAGTAGVFRSAFSRVLSPGLPHRIGFPSLCTFFLSHPLHRAGYPARHRPFYQANADLIGFRTGVFVCRRPRVGTGLGVGVSNLFIPMLQVGGPMAAQVPPFQVQINWLSVFQIYILLGMLFAAALGILTAMLVHMKIFEVIN